MRHGSVRGVVLDAARGAENDHLKPALSKTATRGPHLFTEVCVMSVFSLLQETKFQFWGFIPRVTVITNDTGV